MIFLFVYFYLKELISHDLPPILLEQHPVLRSFLAGSLSGTCSTLLFQPFDLVKTRIQNANFALNTATANTGIVTSAGESVPNRVFPILFNVVKNEQFLGLWRGTLPVSLYLFMFTVFIIVSSSYPYLTFHLFSSQ